MDITNAGCTEDNGINPLTNLLWTNDGHEFEKFSGSFFCSSQDGSLRNSPPLRRMYCGMLNHEEEEDEEEGTQMEGIKLFSFYDGGTIFNRSSTSQWALLVDSLRVDRKRKWEDASMSMCIYVGGRQLLGADHIFRTRS